MDVRTATFLGALVGGALWFYGPRSLFLLATRRWSAGVVRRLAADVLSAALVLSFISINSAHDRSPYYAALGVWFAGTALFDLLCRPRTDRDPIELRKFD